MKRVIITGASGFIGQALTEALLDQGTEVYGVCAHPEKLGEIKEHPLFHLVQLKFKEYGSLAEKIPAGVYDVFFHFAWQGYGKATNDYKVQIPNIQYTCDAASAAAELGCKRFVLADSSHEYLVGPDNSGSVGLCSVYGAAKASAQRFCRVLLHNTDTEYIGVLFTNVFGPGDRSSRSTNTLLRKLLSGKDLDLIPGERLYDWTYIDDCVGGVIAAARDGKAGRVYYVGSRYLKPFSEIITEVRDTVAPGAALNFGKYHDSTYIDYSHINTYALYNDTGYLPNADLREGIQKTARWLKMVKD